MRSTPCLLFQTHFYVIFPPLVTIYQGYQSYFVRFFSPLWDIFTLTFLTVCSFIFFKWKFICHILQGIFHVHLMQTVCHYFDVSLPLLWCYPPLSFIAIITFHIYCELFPSFFNIFLELKLHNARAAEQTLNICWMNEWMTVSCSCNILGSGWLIFEIIGLFYIF